MDFSSLPLVVVKEYWFLLVLLLLFTLLRSIFNTARFKGWIGEVIVNMLANLFLDKKKYHLVRNITVPTEDGSTQIDHIIVSEFGVFVIDTKNYRGWIFGSVNEKNWIQKIYKHTQSFQNPLHQNYKHVKTLESLLQLKPEQFFSLIIFIGDSVFKTKMPENITQKMGYIRFIKSKKKALLSPLEVTEVLRKIETTRFTPSMKTNREHIYHVKGLLEKKNNHDCPHCGVTMIFRDAKAGQGKKYWSCPKYPRCKGIKYASLV